MLNFRDFIFTHIFDFRKMAQKIIYLKIIKITTSYKLIRIIDVTNFFNIFVFTNYDLFIN